MGDRSCVRVVVIRVLPTVGPWYKMDNRSHAGREQHEPSCGPV